MATRRQKHRSQSATAPRAPAKQADDTQPAPDDTRGPNPEPAWVQALHPSVLLPALAVASILATVAAVPLYGFATAVLVAVAGALVLAVWQLWSSLQLLATQPEAHTSLPVPAGAEVEQKTALLRVLDDLDYERGLGKISEQDYEEQREQVREQARNALEARALATEQARAYAEALLAERLREAKLGPSGRPAATDALDEATRQDASNPPTQSETKPHAKVDKRDRRSCPSCEVSNEPDARFCKKCGRELLLATSPSEEAQ